MNVKLPMVCLLAVLSASMMPMANAAAMCSVRQPLSNYGLSVHSYTASAPATVQAPQTQNPPAATQAPQTQNPPAATQAPQTVNPPAPTQESYQSYAQASVAVSLYSGCSYVSPVSPVPVYNEPDKDVILQYHNEYRQHFQENDLVWDDSLATTAYLAGLVLAKTCGGLTHASEYCLANQLKLGGQGENLASGYSNWRDVVNGWAGDTEEAVYKQYPDQFSEGAGHFTQVVWKSTTAVGCAKVQSYGCSTPYYVCRYNPPGNYNNDYAENVPDPRTNAYYYDGFQV